MEKVLKYISKIASVTFLVCFILYLGYGLKGEVFLKVNDDNKNLLLEMCEKEGISLNGELTKIGCKQGLGDWYLYLKYKDGSLDKSLINDTVGADLRTYIRENGQVGGTSGLLVKSLMKISVLIIGMYIVCIVVNMIRKKNRVHH